MSWVFHEPGCRSFGEAWLLRLREGMGGLVVGYANARIACGNGNSYGLGTSTRMICTLMKRYSFLKEQSSTRFMFCRVCLESRQFGEP